MARSRNHSWRGKVIGIIYSERVFVALVILRAKRMRRFALSPVACQSLPNVPTLSHTRRDFLRKIIEHKMCVLFFSTTFVISTQKCACKLRVILVGLEPNLNILDTI